MQGSYQHFLKNQTPHCHVDFTEVSNEDKRSID
jgi:hypothetical protein